MQRDGSPAKLRGWVLEGEPDLEPAAALAVQQGWTGIGISEDDGGQGGGLQEIAILAEELGRGAFPADSLYATLIAARALLDSGAAEHVSALAEGDRSAALVRSASTPLDADQDDQGGSPLVWGAPGAELLLTVDGGRIRAVEAAEADITPRPLLDRTRSIGELSLPSASGEELGEAELGSAATWAAVLVAADGLGAAQRMLELTVDYVKDRIQFGVPVGSFQAVKHAASEMVVAIEGTRGVVEYAAWAVAAEQPGAATDAWVAKARSARAASLVADKALFLHGAVGYTWEHDLQLLFKRAKSAEQLLGGPGVYEQRIADSLELIADG